MYTGFLHTHNMFRWLILLILTVAVILAFAGWTGKSNWKKRDNTIGLLLTIFIDIQFLIGIILYTFLSPLTKSAFHNFGVAMKNENLRFYAVEHIFIMIISLVLIHIGRAKSKKTDIEWKKHRVSAVFYGIALVLILTAIPWDRAFF